MSSITALPVVLMTGGRSLQTARSEEVLPLFRKVHGPNSPHTLGAMGNLVNSYAAARRWAEAAKLRAELDALKPK